MNGNVRNIFVRRAHHGPLTSYIEPGLVTEWSIDGLSSVTVRLHDFLEEGVMPQVVETHLMHAIATLFGSTLKLLALTSERVSDKYILRILQYLHAWANGSLGRSPFFKRKYPELLFLPEGQLAGLYRDGQISEVLKLYGGFLISVVDRGIRKAAEGNWYESLVAILLISEIMRNIAEQQSNGDDPVKDAFNASLQAAEPYIEVIKPKLELLAISVAMEK